MYGTSSGEPWTDLKSKHSYADMMTSFKKRMMGDNPRLFRVQACENKLKEFPKSIHGGSGCLFVNVVISHYIQQCTLGPRVFIHFEQHHSFGCHVFLFY